MSLVGEAPRGDRALSVTKRSCADFCFNIVRRCAKLWAEDLSPKIPRNGMRKIILLFLVSLARTAGVLQASENPLFHSSDPLATRDEWGTFHQMPSLNEVDFARRDSSRLFYYSRSGRTLLSDPAYVGSAQVSLQRWGYYCGPIDGLFSSEVGDAIARMQKAYGMRVTGRLTLPVRRALYLP